MKWNLKKILLILLFSLPVCCIYSQKLNFVIQPSNPYRTAVKDVFNLSIFNPSTQNVNIYLLGKIELQGSGLIAELKSKSISITPGNNKLVGEDLEIDYLTFIDQSIQQFENETGSLPPGNYKMCLNTGCANQDCDGLGAGFVYFENPLCKEVTIMLPSPLLLNTPRNAAEIETTRPQLTWIPPMPIASQQSLTYSLRLTEKMTNQSAIDAVSRNRPILEQSGIEEIFLNYPPDAEELDTSKQYAWQVEAYSGNLKIATSEAWYFRFKKKIIKPVSNICVILKQDDNDIHTTADTLKVIYKENRESGRPVVVIKNEIGKQILIDQSINSIYGENLLKFDLSDSRFVNDKIYYLVLTNESGQKFNLKFHVIK